jgi:hypothetical protein
MVKESILTDFQAFLRSRKLVPEKNIPYFAFWAGKFLAFARKRAVSYKQLASSFKLKFLKQGKSDERV